ncbi:transcription antitermination factor NusB [Patiriisocius hiemis]|uniref:Transcription antitermination factor NusB n=1 Tax=Patiriisocius hiemis TaxID=3075604 RepID=A0ABU2YDJ4_9FLAO|nr:transcription antitermination factor NusB [Constantimarinum sp. W242]MDT0555118.1 transcription antitermination factor NusB [Constantimarinum sp. W242]
MLTRRHIRIKVVQSVYAFHQSENPDIEKQEKFLLYSVQQIEDLYLLMLQLLVDVQKHAETYMLRSQKKHLATQEEKNPSKNFINNNIPLLISETPLFSESIKNKKLDLWKQDDEYVTIIFNELRNAEWYKEYLAIEAPNFNDDKNCILKLYKEVIAPNEKLYDYLEDKRLTWLDDFPVVNTAIIKMIGQLSKKNSASIVLPELYKNEEDKEYATSLFRKIILHNEKLEKEIEGKTPNWDKERIADIDMVILKLGITEFLHFPSIPTRVTINECLEIAKEYSTPKSSIFINGILDKLVKEFEKSQKLKKIGRGLR